MSSLKNTKTLTFAAMLTAIAVVLGFFKIPVNSLVEIRFQSLPVCLGGMVLGPGIGAVIGALTDILSYLVRPTGAYFPGFTISSMLTGIIFALLLYRRPLTLWRVIMAELINTAVVSCILNSLWLSILYHVAFWQSLLARLPKSLVMIPINVILLWAVLHSTDHVLRKAASV